MRVNNKKDFEEKLQEARHKGHDKIQYRRRMQEEKEFDKMLEEELKRLDEDPVL